VLELGAAAAAAAHLHRPQEVAPAAVNLLQLLLQLNVAVLKARPHVEDGLQEEEEEEGLHGVFKRLRRNGHQLIKEAANSSTLTVTHGRLNPQNSLCM
jgi:hypothetical protein